MTKNKSYYPKPGDNEMVWHHVDVGGKVLGKVAAEIASKLIGKHNANFTPGVLGNDKVVVTNAQKVAVTGKKMEQKTYYRHSDYPGGLKSETLKESMEKHPERVIERAVKGMLPQNKNTKKYMTNLYVYAGSEHPHEAQFGKKEDK